ncbi:hypothetical protein NMG60_11004043 [Bertholletia excelsa]
MHFYILIILGQSTSEWRRPRQQSESSRPSPKSSVGASLVGTANPSSISAIRLLQYYCRLLSPFLALSRLFSHPIVSGIRPVRLDLSVFCPTSFSSAYPEEKRSHSLAS